MEFTPNQKNLLAVLADGNIHSKEELLEALDDPLAPITALRNQLSKLRKKLRLKGETIVCEVAYRRYYYRHIRLLAPHDE